MCHFTWKDIYVRSMLVINCYVNANFQDATMIHFVTSQCSEAHRQACSYSYIQLKAVSATITPSDKYVPDYNKTTLKHVCDLFTEYNNCSQPFLSTCNNHTVMELQTYDITLGLICKDLFSDYLVNKNCFQRLKSSYKSCKGKEITSTDKVTPTGPAHTYILCSSARKYALCVYTATALGCSMSAADVYFSLLNHTISNIFTINRQKCVLRHPMDEISIYTTSSSTTSGIWNAQTSTENIQDTPKHYKEVSSADCVNSLYVLIYILVLFLYFFIQQNSIGP